jgi:sterol desaturase/sphingolipid hydroxylase (fatty acid hydroxylase superfamily)
MQHQTAIGSRIGKPLRPLANFLWTLPQPVLVFGAMFLVASAYSTGWTDADQLTTALLLMPIPLLLLAERLKPKRADWVLNWKEYAEDAFWVLCVYLIWVPLYDDYYDTPISEAFAWLRDAALLPISLDASTTLGLIGVAMLANFASEFVYYWLHRLQHRMMFFWRIHATHHHITKMGVARADRTHPLEFLALNLGPAIILALLGASSAVVAVALTFRIFGAYTNHANLPLKSGWYGWLFTTPEWHQLHHSKQMTESDSNFGCSIIFWDRVFGTFSGKTEIEAVGNGTGKALSIYTQLTMPFRSNETLRNL